MVAASGILVPISGSAQFDVGGLFELVQFDGVTSMQHQADNPIVTTYSGLVIENDTFLTTAQRVTFEAIGNRVYDATTSGATTWQALVIDYRDFNFVPRTVTSGITVINFGFGSGFSFTPPMVSNRRIFPTDVANATLFPGDVPRGTPLN